MRHGRRVAIAAKFAILLVALTKYFVGQLFNLGILVADAYHSAVDVVAVLASWVGLRIASGGKSRKFPYGLYRVETMSALLIGGLIIWAGVENLIRGYERPFHRAAVTFPAVPLAAGLLSMAVAYIAARQQKKAGDAINSQALRTTAADSLLDVLTSLVVVIGPGSITWQFHM